MLLPNLKKIKLNRRGVSVSFLTSVCSFEFSNLLETPIEIDCLGKKIWMKYSWKKLFAWFGRKLSKCTHCTSFTVLGWFYFHDIFYGSPKHSSNSSVSFRSMIRTSFQAFMPKHLNRWHSDMQQLLQMLLYVGGLEREWKFSPRKLFLFYVSNFPNKTFMYA